MRKRKQGKDVVRVLRKIYRKPVSIKKELQAIRSSLEHNYKINSKDLSKELKEIGVKLSYD